MQTSNNTVAKGKGKESIILLLIGIIGIAGLVYLFTSSSSKSGFSEIQIEQQIETAAADQVIIQLS